ncbi:MAG: hypothetical protein WKG00_10135 [Polyangiaceae bacterium]
MLRFFGPIAAILVTTTLVACSGTVVEGDGGSSGDPTGGDPTGGDPSSTTGGDPSSTTGGDPTGPSGGNPTSGNSTGGNPDPVTGTAVALTRAQLDVLWDEYWDENGGSSGSTTGSSGGTPLDPNDLVLHFSDLGVSCGSPTVDLGCGHWHAYLVLPPALQQVGVYDLADPAIMQFSVISDTFPDDGTGRCGGGSGPVEPGTLEITAISDTQVDFVVTASVPFSDPSGTYSAPRCP